MPVDPRLRSTESQRSGLVRASCASSRWRHSTIEGRGVEAFLPVPDSDGLCSWMGCLQVEGPQAEAQDWSPSCRPGKIRCALLEYMLQQSTRSVRSCQEAGGAGGVLTGASQGRQQLPIAVRENDLRLWSCGKQVLCCSAWLFMKIKLDSSTSSGRSPTWKPSLEGLRSAEDS